MPFINSTCIASIIICDTKSRIRQVVSGKAWLCAYQGHGTRSMFALGFSREVWVSSRGPECTAHLTKSFHAERIWRHLPSFPKLLRRWCTGSHRKIFWHNPTLYIHVCAEDRLPICCLRIWQPCSVPIPGLLLLLSLTVANDIAFRYQVMCCSLRCQLSAPL